MPIGEIQYNIFLACCSTSCRRAVGSVVRVSTVHVVLFRFFGPVPSTLRSAFTMFKSTSLSFLIVILWSVIAGVQSAPARGNGNGGGNNQTPQQQAAAIPQGISKAKDGSTILDTTVTIK
jgi:hypothetical protein